MLGYSASPVYHHSERNNLDNISHLISSVQAHFLSVISPEFNMSDLHLSYLVSWRQQPMCTDVHRGL